MSSKRLVLLCLIVKIFCTEASIIPNASPTNGVRLVNGSTKNEGRVEVFYQGSWGTVCDDDWDLQDANVVCKMLGYLHATEALPFSAFGNGTGKIVLDNVNCSAEEAKSGNVDELKVIYQKSKSLDIIDDVMNTQDEEGGSALHWSIVKRNIEAAEYIIQIGANVNTATNEKNKYEGDTPLISASFYGLISIVMQLVNHGARIDTKRKDGGHAAGGAAQEGHLEVVKFLIQEEPKVVDLKGFDGKTPLIAAAKNGHLNIVKYLLSYPQVDIDSQSNGGESPLMLASWNNHTDVVKFLVQEGANIELKRKDGPHAAYMAARKGNLDILKFLVQNAPDVVDLEGYVRRTPLGAAALNGLLNVVNYLISQPNVDVDSQENNGFTPLMLATYKNQEKVVQILLQKGAEKSIKDTFGKTALDYAKSKKFVNIIEILKQ